MDILGSKDPWAMTKCHRGDCLICNSLDKKEKSLAAFQKESVCYLLTCERCRLAGCRAEYCGETARTPYLRRKEHSRSQAKEQEDSALHKHDVLHHGGLKGHYNMTVLRTHHKPLARQIQEATHIENSTADIILN